MAQSIYKLLLLDTVCAGSHRQFCIALNVWIKIVTEENISQTHTLYTAWHHTSHLYVRILNKFSGHESCTKCFDILMDRWNKYRKTKKLWYFLVLSVMQQYIFISYGFLFLPGSPCVRACPCTCDGISRGRHCRHDTKIFSRCAGCLNISVFALGMISV